MATRCDFLGTEIKARLLDAINKTDDCNGSAHAVFYGAPKTTEAYIEAAKWAVKNWGDKYQALVDALNGG